ncbi:MAG: SHOCT domain-containing protein [Bacillota bacterium]
MSQKIYVKPPQQSRGSVIALIVLTALFLPWGIMFSFIAEGEARPFAIGFALIWVTVCVALIVHAVNVLRLTKAGKIEVAEMEGAAGEASGCFAARLRALEALKNDGLISDDEYRRKRIEIMQKKW